MATPALPPYVVSCRRCDPPRVCLHPVTGTAKIVTYSGR